jgi:hypothetical protein
VVFKPTPNSFFSWCWLEEPQGSHVIIAMLHSLMWKRKSSL